MNIQNNTQSLGFGQLIITPEARTSIRRCKDIQILEKLTRAQNDMANTEFFDIVLCKGLKCKLKSLKEAFFGAFESKEYGSVSTGVNDNTLELGDYSVSRHTIYGNDEEYGYSVWKTKELGDVENAEHIDTLVKIAQELDKQAKRHEKRSLGQNIKVQYTKKLQNQLLGTTLM